MKELPPGWQTTVAKAASRNELSDPRLLFSLLQAENGPKNIEFSYGITERDGKKTTSSPSYLGFANQANAAAWQIRTTEDRYRRSNGKDPVLNGHYTNDFIKYFSSGGKGYAGYAPIGADNDPNNLNAAHYPNMANAYKRMTTNTRTGRFEPWEPRKVSMNRQEEAGPFVPIDQYIESAIREDGIGIIRRNFGDAAAERAAALQDSDMVAAIQDGYKLIEPTISYVGDKVADGFHLLEEGGKYIRGGLLGRPGEQASVEEFTGLEDEPSDPNFFLYDYGALGAIVHYPRWATNQVAEVFTSPEVVAGGAVGAGIKVARTVKKGLDATKGVEASAKLRQDNLVHMESKQKEIVTEGGLTL